MKNDISLLTGLKNNLEYSKHFYQTTRALYPDVELVFVSYGSTDGTHEWLDNLNDSNLKYYYSAENKTFSDTYNKCTELATKTYVLYAHNDMIIAPGFIEALSELVSPDTAITYTVVEPPIFADDERPGKLIKDCGADVEAFDIKCFYDFATETQKLNTAAYIETRLAFFLCVHRQTLLSIGGLDPLYNPMFCEDDDLIIRFKLLGLKTLVSLNAIAYHFVSKTSRFSEEYQQRTKQIELSSNRNFIRKWGFPLSSQVKKKYDIGFVIKNATNELLEKIEPYAATIYADGNFDSYINKEQANTKINLKEKIKPFNTEKTNDVLVHINGRNFKERTFRMIHHMDERITRKAHKKLSIVERLIGKSNKRFKADSLIIKIINLRNREHELINRHK